MNRMISGHGSLLAGLPVPDAELQAHSDRLVAVIHAEIAASGGAITFARFMELALYAPGLGYYSAGLRKFGVGGDFVTAPEFSSLFSYCMARQCREVLGELGGGAILEFGAGSGVMAADILAELERLNALPERYDIVELSAALRARQQETLAARVPQLLGRVNWQERLPEAGFRGVVLANEVLDAMPMHRFVVEKSGPAELYVRSQDEGFAWHSGPLSDAGLARALGSITADIPVGYSSEISLAIPAWINSLAGFLEAGVVLLVDYGFTRREYYHSERSAGTLMCHYRHRAHADPLVLVGLQDITAHVDFTAIAEAAVDGCFRVGGYTTQAYFLLATGLQEMMAASNPDDPRRHLELTRQVKRLTLPHEMGELFKVMVLSKDSGNKLMGFQLRDLRGNL